jgi:membrane protein
VALPGDIRETRSERESQAPHWRLILQPTLILRLLKAAWSEFRKDNAMRMSAALGYYIIFSIAPLLVISVAIAAVVFGRKAAEGAIIGEIQGFIGTTGAQAIQTMIQSAQRPAHGAVAAIVGLLVLLWGASTVFAEMHDALNTIWDVDENAQSGIVDLVRTRFSSFGLVFAIGFLLLVSLLLSAALAALGKYAGNSLGVPVALFHVTDAVVSMIVISTLFAMIFRILPDLRVPWGDVWIGAVLTAMLFTAGKFAIGFYIGKSVATSTYGAAASLVVVVAWIYYSALILYFGAEFTHVFSNEVGSTICQKTQAARS